MPIIKSQIKSVKQDRKREQKNKSIKSLVRTHISNFNQAIDKKDKKLAEEILHKAIKALDKAASKKVIHPNQAANKKSRLMKKFNTI